VKIDKKYLIFLLVILSTVGNAAAHPFFVSICEVHFNRETSSLELSIKTFTDDLTSGLVNQGHEHLNIGEENEDTATDQYLYAYLKKVLKFTINGKAVDYKFIGKEEEDAVVWTYLEIQGITELKELEVECSLLTEIHDTQSNMIQVDKDGKIKNILLDKRKTFGSLTFD